MISATTTRPRHRTPSRLARPALLVALAAILLKLPQAVIGLLVPEGSAYSPPAAPVAVWVTLAWVAFSLALLALRRWLGLISAAWFCLVSGVSGVRLFDELPLWGGWQVATAAVALAALGVAVAAGVFRGSRW